MNAHKVDDTMGVARASTAIQCIIGSLSNVMALVAKGSTPEFRRQAINSLMGDGTMNKSDVVVENMDEPQMVCVNCGCVQAKRRHDLYLNALRNEKTQVLTCLMVLTTFLREHAIIEYNTAFEERIKLEIKTEEGNENWVAVNELSKILEDYKTKIKIQNQMQHEKIKDTTTEQVVKTLKKLFELPLYGSTISKLYQKELPPSEAADARDFIRLHVKYIPPM